MAAQPNLLDRLLTLPGMMSNLGDELCAASREADGKLKSLVAERELRPDLIQLLSELKSLLYNYMEAGLDDAAAVGTLALMFRDFAALLDGIGELEPSSERF